MKKIIAMIPARMASTRFPGKPLVNICGKTMIEHVWQRVRLNKNISDVFIVTCDEEIRKTAEAFKACAIMTSDKHTRCTDRTAEGCLSLIKKGENFDVVLNIQGDEPLLEPSSLDLLMAPFCEDEDVSCVNMIESLETEEEIYNKNNVKAIFDQKNFVMYFSRLPIPIGLEQKHYKQLGLYGLRKDSILKYPGMKETPLEIAESCDMLRFIENRMPVKVVFSPHKTFGVDTPEDYKKVCSLMEINPVFSLYRNR